ncbi:glycosyltransferase [Pseudolabrys taiwanensis]|uniref:Glycosyltransferase n=1 Tax=Pseudolabrys taiwanensis TaxID=331696 RepID=A0A345ZXX3_9HYPH|nr:glycosyltransferase [Pseudolabrys taiwanensis]AXK81770.1 glycosyltransferase [Pseudolabrys taiwanensis]
MFSIVTPNRNRLEHLKQALPSWQRAHLISEIVIVDYGSDHPIKLEEFSAADKVKLVRVEGAVDWRIGHATNIGIDFATNERILKLDSDIVLDDERCLEKIDLTGCFYRGHFQTSVPNGEAIFLKDHWRTIGGYHEWLSGYGFDDSDFYIRLRANALAEVYLPTALLHTIPHSQELRGSYRSIYRFGSIDHAETRADFDLRKNTLLSFMQKWQQSLRTPYAVLSEESQYITVRSEHVRDRSTPQDAIAERSARFI